MSDIKIDFSAPKLPPLPAPPPIECSILDHSEYKESGNYWNSLEWVAEKKVCAKCGRPPYQEWFRAINWQSRDIEYWRKIFRAAAAADRGLDAELPFFYLWESKGWAGQRLVRGDEDFEAEGDALFRPLFGPKSVLKMLERRYRFIWRKQGGMTLIEHIRRHRYEARLPVRKENRYPGFDSLLRMELDDLAKDFDCVDNRRFAEVKNRKDMKRYRKQRDIGCCGSVDKKFSIMGRMFMIGFNHGH